jgi:hypothetical protein
MKKTDKHPCSKRESKPRSQHPGGEDLRIRPYGHRDWHKQDVHCLLKWLAACIHFGCDFCTQFHCSISLITAWNISYYGVLRMPDLRTVRLNRLKNERLHSYSDQRASKGPDRLRPAHCHLKYTVTFFLLGEHLVQWYLTFFVRVPTDIISLQLCTPKVVGA